MRRMITLTVVVVIILTLFTGCTEKVREARRVREEAKQQLLIQSNANKVIDTIKYIKDPRTNLCFTYYWGDEPNASLSITTVPCDSISPELLTVAE